MIEETTNTVKNKLRARTTRKPNRLISYYCSPIKKKSAGAGKTAKVKALKMLPTHMSLKLSEFNDLIPSRKSLKLSELNDFIPSNFAINIREISQDEELKPSDRLAKIVGML